MSEPVAESGRVEIPSVTRGVVEFTWEDVEVLRKVAPTLQGMSVKPVAGTDWPDIEMERTFTGIAGMVGRQGDVLASLADRIEALLPPRET